MAYLGTPGFYLTWVNYLSALLETSQGMNKEIVASYEIIGLLSCIWCRGPEAAGGFLVTGSRGMLLITARTAEENVKELVSQPARDGYEVNGITW